VAMDAAGITARENAGLPRLVQHRKKAVLTVQYPDLPRSGIRPAKTSLANRTYWESGTRAAFG